MFISSEMRIRFSTDAFVRCSRIPFSRLNPSWFRSWATNASCSSTEAFTATSAAFISSHRKYTMRSTCYYWNREKKTRTKRERSNGVEATTAHRIRNKRPSNRMISSFFSHSAIYTLLCQVAKVIPFRRSQKNAEHLLRVARYISVSR